MIDKPAHVRSHRHEERVLVDRIVETDSKAAWEIGELASEWVTAYARGRSFEDLAKVTGIGAETLRQRAKVWKVFGEHRKSNHGLKFSHYRTAFCWEDAEECLGWASENEASVAEMKAWRRAKNGEELGEPAEEGPEADSGPQESATAPEVQRDGASGVVSVPDISATPKGSEQPSATPAKVERTSEPARTPKAGGDTQNPPPEPEGGASGVAHSESTVRALGTLIRRIEKAAGTLTEETRSRVAQQLRNAADAISGDGKGFKLINLKDVPDDLDREFDAFWDAYPRRIGKAKAKQAYKRARTKQGLRRDDLMRAVAQFAEHVRAGRTEEKYIPHPSSWLNAGRYDDELAPTGQGDAVAGDGSVGLQGEGPHAQAFGGLAKWLHKATGDAGSVGTETTAEG